MQQESWLQNKIRNGKLFSVPDFFMAIAVQCSSDYRRAKYISAGRAGAMFAPARIRQWQAAP